MSFLSQSATNTSGVKVNWMLHQIDHEFFLAQQDIVPVCEETAMFLTPLKLSKSTRHRRGSRMSLAAFAAVGLFGGRLAVGSSNSGGSRGTFGKCQEKSRQIEKMYAALLVFKNFLLITLRNL